MSATAEVGSQIHLPPELEVLRDEIRAEIRENGSADRIFPVSEVERLVLLILGANEEGRMKPPAITPRYDRDDRRRERLSITLQAEEGAVFAYGPGHVGLKFVDVTLTNTDSVGHLGIHVNSVNKNPLLTALANRAIGDGNGVIDGQLGAIIGFPVQGSYRVEAGPLGPDGQHVGQLHATLTRAPQSQ